MNREEKVNRAIAFYAKANCAQACFAAFAEEAGLKEEEVLSIAAAFGGGIAGMGQICGALTGTLMALGAIEGQKPGFNQKQFMADMKAFAEEFESEFSSLQCCDLKAKNEADLANGSLQLAEGEKACNRYVKYAVEKAVDYLNRP